MGLFLVSYTLKFLGTLLRNVMLNIYVHLVLSTNVHAHTVCVLDIMLILTNVQCTSAGAWMCV